jgi:glycosyltransferase involved in cell wall biosynthesis
MGSGHPPNANAARYIATVLAPALPDVDFNVIGSCLPEGCYEKNVIRHGVVDDNVKWKLLDEAKIALNPMTDGGGSNLKVLDYFSSGLPVLSTAFGMRGIKAIAGKDYVEGSLDNFIEVFRRVITDEVNLRAIGASGRAVAMQKYTWDAVAQSVSERIEALAVPKSESNERRFVLALNDYDSFEGVGGGATRSRGLYEAVSKWSPVLFLTFSTDGRLSARAYSSRIMVLAMPTTVDHVANRKRVNSQFHVSCDDIIASQHCLDNPWLTDVYRTLRAFARSIVVEHCYLARLPAAYEDRFVYSSQNNETELKKQLLEWHPLKQELLNEVELVERLAIERSAAIVAVSEQDAESLVKGRRTAAPIVVVRNGASMPASGSDVDRLRSRLSKQVGGRSAVFLGSAHTPNVDAAKFIVETLAPKCPDVEFHLVGSVCNSVTAAPKNVQLWGVLDEITKSAVLQSCGVALNPVNTGSGSNVKLADYLANGLFVITTDFGQRGYPTAVFNHIWVSSLEHFANAIGAALNSPERCSVEARTSRRVLFENELSMNRLASRFVELLKNFERPKKRVLYVAYRYVFPALGGAEVNIEKFVAALGNSGEYDVDVVAPEISGIHNLGRFGESYSFDISSCAPVNIPNVRFARFPADRLGNADMDSYLRKAWRAQPLYEKAIDAQLSNRYSTSGITWGWNYPEGHDNDAQRWVFTECGLFLSQSSLLELQGYSPDPIVITVSDGATVIAGPWSVQGNFNLAMRSPATNIVFQTSARSSDDDPRPLGFRVIHIQLNGIALDLSAPTLCQETLRTLPANEVFMILDKAASQSRGPLGVRLTDTRGPWSASMERYIKDCMTEYDLVVTHNNVFRPAVVAVDEAKKQGIPSILIPHAHLDDDFYHFPDVIESVRNASLVLAAPKATCDFLDGKGCKARYMPAGVDVDEQFSNADREAFATVYTQLRPFVLVLGRKAIAKGYQQIVRTIDQLNDKNVDIGVVLIGPDDDGEKVDSPNATYLGHQPRDIVRGALKACVGLVNMSSSESFGIVLLEAWLAGKPIIVNKNCTAFGDLATHGENAILVDPQQLGDAIFELLEYPEKMQILAERGKQKAFEFDWRTVSAKFLECCAELTMKH